jgi:protein involved in polysaccharide export with SLBB domain
MRPASSALPAWGATGETPKENYVINLGDKVRDMVTGIQGIATARTTWLNGCVRVTLEYAGGKKDEALEVKRETFDEEQLEIVKAGAVVPLSRRGTVKRSGGGGRPDPSPHP